MVSRTKGKFRFGQGFDLRTKDYDINDLGINFITNYYSLNGFAGYRILNPTKIFNNFNSNVSYYLQYHKETGEPMESGINANIDFSTKKNDWYGASFWTSPNATYDYYEPRVEGRFLFVPKSHGFNTWLSTNYNRKLAVDINFNFNKSEQYRRQSLGFGLSPRFRFNDKFSLNYSFSYNKQLSDIGFTATQNNDIVLIERDRDTYLNTVTGKYAINAEMTFNLSVRHYWSISEKIAFHNLQENGRWTPNNTYTDNRNDNFNLWNFDFSYSWWFVPGSQLNFLYRNNAFSSTRDIDRNLNNNISNLFQDNLNHTFSLSLRYFLDYNQVKGWFKKV